MAKNKVNPAEETQPLENEASAPAEKTLTIRLKRVYQGRPSNEQPIRPGDYNETDPRLFGLAHYLLQNGHAEIVA